MSRAQLKTGALCCGSSSGTRREYKAGEWPPIGGCLGSGSHLRWSDFALHRQWMHRHTELGPGSAQSARGPAGQRNPGSQPTLNCRISNSSSGWSWIPRTDFRLRVGCLDRRRQARDRWISSGPRGIANGVGVGAPLRCCRPYRQRRHGGLQLPARPAASRRSRRIFSRQGRRRPDASSCGLLRSEQADCR